MPPFNKDPDTGRPIFAALRQHLEDLQTRHPNLDHLTELSMGMSHDFHVAIAEGATLIRVGSALFGPRGT